MKRFSLLLMLAVCLIPLFFAACSGEKSYKIVGSFDIPDSIEVGDTVIAREPLDSSYVYMIDIDGTFFDSAMVINDCFEFNGKVKDPYFVYIASQYNVGLCVIEPGEISILMSDETLVSGTQSNDAILDFDMQMKDCELALYQIFDSLSVADSTAADSVLMPYLLDYQIKVLQIMDSVYAANPANLVGVYVANMKTVSARSAAQLELMLEEFDPYVIESDFIQQRLEYLRGHDAYQDISTEMFDDELPADFDSLPVE